MRAPPSEAAAPARRTPPAHRAARAPAQSAGSLQYRRSASAITLHTALFARECAPGSGKRLVFKRFELRGNVALGVFQRLAAAVVVRHFVRLAARDFNIKPMHFVVLDAQIGDAGARA